MWLLFIKVQGYVTDHNAGLDIFQISDVLSYWFGGHLNSIYLRMYVVVLIELLLMIKKNKKLIELLLWNQFLEWIQAPS